MQMKFDFSLGWLFQTSKGMILKRFSVLSFVLNSLKEESKGISFTFVRGFHNGGINHDGSFAPPLRPRRLRALGHAGLWQHAYDHFPLHGIAISCFRSAASRGADLWPRATKR